MKLTDNSSFPSVHLGIVHAAVILLALEQHPAAKRFSAGDVETLVAEADAPDRSRDRQCGRGLHYYCASLPNGKPSPKRSFYGGYCNARGLPAPSPLTMMDAEYRSALSLYRAGKSFASMQSLSRALHMIADLCCPPHSCGLTYYSAYGMAHKRYEMRAATIFWRYARSIPDAGARWAKQTVGLVPYNAYKNLLDGSIPLKNGKWRAGTFVRICNRVAESGVKELPAVLGDDEKALDSSIHRRLILSIAHCAAMLAAFDRDVADPNLHVPGEQIPYYLCSSDFTSSVSESPLFLHFEENGTATIFNKKREVLAVRSNGSVVLTQNPDGMIARFHFGREPLLTLFPENDRLRLLAVSHGQLHCMRRTNLMEDPHFAAQTAFVLSEQKPAHAKFIYP